MQCTDKASGPGGGPEGKTYALTNHSLVKLMKCYMRTCCIAPAMAPTFAAFGSAAVTIVICAVQRPKTTNKEGGSIHR